MREPPWWNDREEKEEEWSPYNCPDIARKEQQERDEQEDKNGQR